MYRGRSVRLYRSIWKRVVNVGMAMELWPGGLRERLGGFVVVVASFFFYLSGGACLVEK